MVESERVWNRAAWLGLFVGVALAYWGASMGFNRRGVVNWEAVIRGTAGASLIVIALVIATVVAPRLSALHRRVWAVMVWIATAVSAWGPLTWVVAATSTCRAGEPSAAVGCGMAYLQIGALGAVVIASFNVRRHKKASPAHKRQYGRPRHPQRLANHPSPVSRGSAHPHRILGHCCHVPTWAGGSFDSCASCRAG